MGDIQYRKGFIIKKRILREDDILRMANLIHKQFQQGDYKEEYELLFDDQSSITGKTIWMCLSLMNLSDGGASAFTLHTNQKG